MVIPVLLSVIVFVVTFGLFWYWGMLEDGIVIIPFVLAGLTLFMSHVIILSGQRFQPKIVQTETYKIVVWNDGEKENSMLLVATNPLYFVPENLLEVDGRGNLRMKD